MAHSPIPNGGLRHSKGELPANKAFGHLGPRLVTVSERGTGKSFALGTRLGHHGNVRCPHCSQISHYKWGEGPHKCEHSGECGKEFKTPT